jgi:hypothetical protein
VHGYPVSTANQVVVGNTGTDPCWSPGVSQAVPGITTPAAHIHRLVLARLWQPSAPIVPAVSDAEPHTRCSQILVRDRVRTTVHVLISGDRNLFVNYQSHVFRPRLQ